MASTCWGHISKICLAVVTRAHTHLDLPQGGCSQSLCVARGNTQQSNERLVHLALVMRIPLNSQRGEGPIRALVNLIHQPLYYAIRSTFVYYSSWSVDCDSLLFLTPTTQCTTQAASPHWPTHHTVHGVTYICKTWDLRLPPMFALVCIRLGNALVAMLSYVCNTTLCLVPPHSIQCES